jgi:hypothetical protein
MEHGSLVHVTLLLCLSACHLQGSGTALLRAPEANTPGGMKTKGQIAFSWQSGGDSSIGEIQASLPDGRRFTGTYVQPTTTTWNDSYGPYWNSWAGVWGSYRPWYGGPRTSFATHYSGKVLAHLETPEGARKRCEFTLFSPSRGLNGGAEGECQLSTNEDAFDAVLEADD